jgi:glycosyltransferase involved in cell wall biosynthesis
LEREWRKLQIFEAQACARFDHIVTVTEEDLAILQDLIHSQEKMGHLDPRSKNQSFSTIPICVDTRSVKPVQPFPDALDVLHLGTMFWLPNVEGVMWFANEVWLKVVAQIHNATFTIAGKNPPAEIRALSKSQKGMSPIQVTGYVPDPLVYLERAGVFIVPLLSGGGMRVKIIDAWRWGLPIVSTTVGAEGIEYCNGDNIIIADEPDDFANAIVKILTDPNLSKRLRINGRRWVETHYDWQDQYLSWDHIYS